MSDTRQLALILSRDVVLFPGAEMPFFVGREATMRAIKYAKANHGGDLALFTQFRAENPGPITRADIFSIGTLTRITASIEMKDNTMKLMLEGISRIRLNEMSIVDDVTIVTVTPLSDTTREEANISDMEKKEVLALLAAWKVDLGEDCERAELQVIRESKNLETIMRAIRSLVASPSINKFGAEPKWFSPENPPTPRYNELTNKAIARRQAILEEPGIKRQLDLIREALAFDISCRSEEVGICL